MAFRLPDQTSKRQRSSPKTSRAAATTLNVSHPSVRADEADLQEWVVFSPVEAQSAAARSYAASTERAPRSTGLSQLSDFGSLDTAARSSGPLDNARSELDTHAGQHQTGQEDDATELDSLDDGLHAFREPQLDESGGPAILPAHDGLGTFEPSGPSAQEQLWRHEQFNPRKVGGSRQRSRSSVQRHLDNANEAQGLDMDQERWQRIEQWRMEQSRYLLQEIEKETRRRRQRKQKPKAKETGDRLSNSQTLISNDPMDTASRIDGPLSVNDAEISATLGDMAPGDDMDSDESFWQRITRRVINGLIGIDDSLLAVIFGESLAPDANESGDSLASPAAAEQRTSSEPGTSHFLNESKVHGTTPSSRADWWQGRLLERIARELGILVHQIYEHPGAFSTYMRANIDPSTEYAGIPLSHPTPTPYTSNIGSRRPSYSNHDNGTPLYSPTFIPTLQDAATSRHAALWGIEEDVPRSSVSAPRGAGAVGNSEFEGHEHEHEYWERELNIKMVFQYLRNRFAPLTTENSKAKSTNTTPKSPQQKTRRQRQHDPVRAAVIRQHHPLVACAEANNRFRHHQSSIIYRHHHHARGAGSTSCASLSQGTRKSVSTKRTVPGESGSSRHYWDIGGSTGSNSALVAVGGGMSNWGDS